jgi:hypothetical protein
MAPQALASPAVQMGVSADGRLVQVATVDEKYCGPKTWVRNYTMQRERARRWLRRTRAALRALHWLLRRTLSAVLRPLRHAYQVRAVASRRAQRAQRSGR